MAKIPVQFIYLTGLNKNIFRNVRLTGSWDNNGYYSDRWTSIEMQPMLGEDGCPCFTATVAIDDSQVGWQFQWGAIVDSSSQSDRWGIPTEINDRNSTKSYRTFTLKSEPQVEKYYFTHCRRLGAQKYYASDRSQPGIQFSVWCPNAQKVDIVFGGESGYIADDGTGIDVSVGTFSLTPYENGIWRTDVREPKLADFSKLVHKPYMFRVTKDNGQVAYRTDLYSRCQIGEGNLDPKGSHYLGAPEDLDGTKSCSLVFDPDLVSKDFTQELLVPEYKCVSQDEFWKDEFTPDKPIPSRIEDLVIYELHLGALGYGKNRPGNFEDAMQLLDYLVDLGINAIELLPMSEFRDEANWGYETSHYFALEYSAGGPHQLKHFVRACHRRGIAVILDVVYNHYSPDGERAQWAYDSNAPDRNIYYWYEGNPANYFYSDGKPFPEGGYIDNMSTGYSPRFHEEMVRKMFIGSATALVTEFHIDGFRADQTTSMHSYNVLHADGRSMGNVNGFGAKFLREWSRTLRLINPNAILIAEDHSDWDKVTESTDKDGLGFDAAWYSNFYHHLIGDTRKGTEYAKLIPTAGLGGNEPLAMDYFAGALAATSRHKVVYHESHDEAGNAYYEDGGQRIESRRTIASAVNGAPLIGETRRFGEARSRFAFGMSVLSAGVPMFLMGEEIGAQKPYRYTDFLANREDLLGDRTRDGKRLFEFYQDLIRLLYKHSGLRAHTIDIIHVHNANRVIAFRRWDDTEELLVVASLNNSPFSSGYAIASSHLGDGRWQEIFNSDTEAYGGYNIGNLGATIASSHGQIHVIIPANGFVVFQRV
jgi:1,4-alpha-glucan branching enzyme